ncbi:hypothetical protein [Gemmata sp.]|uniref:hypothetical protein n=1 Tax=Gemmata sp. TaxID=1914242 RepID=UPI003F6E6D0A
MSHPSGATTRQSIPRSAEVAQPDARRGGYTPLTAGLERRAKAVLDAIPQVIEGRGGEGERLTLRAARCMVRGFLFAPSDARALLDRHYNPKCVPVWSERELEHKVSEAARTSFNKPDGWLLRDRGPATAQPPRPSRLNRRRRRVRSRPPARYSTCTAWAYPPSPGGGQIPEDRTQEVDPLLDLGQRPLGLLLGRLLRGSGGYGPELLFDRVLFGVPLVERRGLGSGRVLLGEAALDLLGLPCQFLRLGLAPGDSPLAFGLDQPPRRFGDTRQQGEQYQARGDHPPLVPPHELLHPVGRAPRARPDHLAAQGPQSGRGRS